MDSNISFNLSLIGKKEAVQEEVFNNLNKLEYDLDSDNSIVSYIKLLIETSMDLYSFGAALQVIINISATKGDLKTKTIEVAVRPVWGFCT